MSQSCSGPQRPVAIPGTRPHSLVSRRVLLRGFGAGAAALAAAPVLLSSTRAGAATAARAGLPLAATTLAGRHGGTRSLGPLPSSATWPQAIAGSEGFKRTTTKAPTGYTTPAPFAPSI